MDIKSKTTMISAGLIAFLLLAGKSFYSCTEKPADEKLRVIRVSNSLPVMSPDTNMVTENNSYELIYSGDLRMYKFPYIFDSIVNRKTVLQDERSFLFVFHKDSSVGRVFALTDSYKMNEGRAKVDSILNFYTYKNPRLEKLISFKIDSTLKNPEGDMVRVYNPPSMDEVGEKYTVYLHYNSRLKGVTESFSPAADNVAGMKLYKYRIYAHGAFYPSENVTMPPRTYVYQMEESSIDKADPILDYFKKYLSFKKK